MRLPEWVCPGGSAAVELPMTLLLAFLLLPLAVAIVLARGEPIRTISCLGAMGVGCVIACSSVVSLIRHRA
jgi:hypothetical protein